MFINEKTKDFIRRHQNDDVRLLALRGAKDAEVDLTQVLQQIAGWQTARRKLPSWAEKEDIIYPPHLNMEQCSSEQTARYKAGLLKGGERYVDLTGGFGVDFYWMAKGFRERVYVEQDAELCAIAEHNFKMMGLSCSICRGDALAYVTEMEPVDVIYLDPARRDEYGARTYGIADCTPNVLELLPVLRQKSRCIMLKLSPMLDWHKAVEELKYVKEVHIVSVDNECKELVLILDGDQYDSIRVCCVNNDIFFDYHSVLQTPCLQHPNTLFVACKQGVCSIQTPPMQYLYEPNASIMKAGCFAELEERFPVRQVAVNSHLFLSADEIGDFPGRKFQIVTISSMNKQDLKAAFRLVERANIAVRNFPLRADQLRNKLKLKEGGDTYVFATTLADGQHRLLICRKIG